jgi:hypothetical protein
MADATSILIHLLRNAWAVLTTFIVVMVAIGVLYRSLTILGGSALGTRYFVAESISSIAVIVVLALLAFIGVPALVRATAASVSGSAGCSSSAGSNPINELAVISAQLIVGIGAVRMLLAFAKGITSATVGASGQVSSALLEVTGAVGASVLASIAVPIAAAFLGSCHG